MKNSMILENLPFLAAKEFLSLVPEKSTNYVNIITDDGCLELLKDIADITVFQKTGKPTLVCVGICLWIPGNTFGLYLPQSFEMQSMQLAATVKGSENGYLKILIELTNYPAPKMSVQEIETAEFTEYYFNPYSEHYSKNPF